MGELGGAGVIETITETMMHEGSDGILRYYTGRFSTRDEARALKAELVDKGFTDAWIATIDDKRPAKH